MADAARDRERVALIAISGLTVLQGAAQIVVPSLTLDAASDEDDATTRQLWGTVGMFMAIVGGWLLDALLRRPKVRSGLPWAAAQKLGAAGAVGLGVRRGVFAPIALSIAVFDAVSGLLAIDYWRRLGRR
jgi:hypothetical protein